MPLHDAQRRVQRDSGGIITGGSAGTPGWAWRTGGFNDESTEAMAVLGAKGWIKAGRGNEFYLVGRARRWRVNCHNEFECSCPLEHFDRWANSRVAQMDAPPKTEAAFLAAISMLREQSKDAR
jgi:hypothetical protein